MSSSNYKVKEYLIKFVAMNKKLGNILKYGVSIALAIVLLYCSFRGVDWRDFMEGLRSCRFEYVVLSMGFGVLAFYLRALRWRELLLPIDRSTSRLTCFNAINISYLVNIALPRVGEFVRCGYISAHSAKEQCDGDSLRRAASYDKVLGTAALERSADVLAMFGILAIFLVFTWKRFGGFFSETIFGAASGGFSAGKVAVMVSAIAVVVAFLTCAILFADKWTPFRKISGFCKGVWEGFLSCLKMKGAWKFLVLTAGVWFCYWMMSATILWALQGISQDSVSPELASAVDTIRSLDLTDALFLMIAGSLSSIVPVPGGFGAFHFIVSSAVAYVYGIPVQFGMIFATLSHESQAVNQILWGGVSWISESLRKTNNQ